MCEPAPAAWRWYLSVAAVREWMRVTGREGPAELTNPHFAEAQAELGGLSLVATLARTPPNRDGLVTYRGKVTVDGRRVRLDCLVQPRPSPDGPLPQLVWVRRK